MLGAVWSLSTNEGFDLATGLLPLFGAQRVDAFWSSMNLGMSSVWLVPERKGGIRGHGPCVLAGGAVSPGNRCTNDLERDIFFCPKVRDENLKGIMGKACSTWRKSGESATEYGVRGGLKVGARHD